MRLGRGSAFPLICASGSVAVAGITSGGMCIGAPSGYAAASVAGAARLSVSDAENQTFLCPFGPSAAQPCSVLSRGLSATSSDAAAFSLCGRGSQWAFARHGAGAFHVCVDGCCRHCRGAAWNDRRRAWIVKKAWTSVPTNNIPCHDGTRTSPRAGLCPCDTTLPHSALARGPPLLRSKTTSPETDFQNLL